MRFAVSFNSLPIHDSKQSLDSEFKEAANDLNRVWHAPRCSTSPKHRLSHRHIANQKKADGFNAVAVLCGHAGNLHIHTPFEVL